MPLRMRVLKCLALILSVWLVYGLDMSLQCDVDPWSRLPDSDTVGNSRNHSLNCGGRDNTLTMCSLPCRWAQPGQYLAPWATHDGMSVAKWIEQWRTLATKFTSLLEQ